jgi:lysophospholipase L1-like esterase
MPSLTPPHFRQIARRLTSWVGSLTVVTAISFASMGLVLGLWPTDQAKVGGVPMGMGAQLELGHPLGGPAALVSHGETRSLRAVQGWGPLRPLLVTTATPDELISATEQPNPASQIRQDLSGAYQRWVLSRSLAILLVAGLLLACVTALLAPWVSWHRRIRLGVILLVALPLLWSGALLGAYQGLSRLQQLTSVTDLFDYQKLRAAPPPIGEKRHGYDVVVIGDSRVTRLGGPVLNAPSPDDQACSRSRDSLAAQLATLDPKRNLHTLNLACSGASVAAGLMGEQAVGGRTLPPQLGLLKQIVQPKVVVLAIGPNDVYWSQFLTACYATACNVTGLEPSINSSLNVFEQGYQDVLEELSQLPGHPQVIILGAYPLFSADQTCADTQYSPGRSVDTAEVNFLNMNTQRLNRLLAAGARRHNFTYTEPRLRPLCSPDSTGLGPDIEGLASPHRFHPTALGELKLASQVAAQLTVEQP